MLLLMQRIYTQMGGDTRAEVVRKAQLTVADCFGHPHHWAAFQMAGAR